MRTEELLSDNTEEKGQYVVSPDPGCVALSEIHRWKKNGALSGAITLLTTTSLSSGVDERPFTIAKDFREMKPSEARNLWAEVIHHPVTAACYLKVNAKRDQKYAQANLPARK